MSAYYVSRQRYFPDGNPVVEIAAGGLDYANPDMLGTKWARLGEGREYADPREAVAAAIAICDAWKAAGESDAEVAFGATGGFTMPFDPSPYADALAWADQAYEKLPKCAQCGDLFTGRERYGCHDFGEYDCCSEYCAEKRYFDDSEDSERES